MSDNRPHAIHWRINCFCNRRCAFCYGPQNLHEVRFDESVPVLDRMIDYGIDTFILTGGEPLLSKKVDKVLEHLHVRGAKTVMYSNCDFFDQHEDMLVACLDTLCVPFEGGSEYVHDSIRGENSLRAILSVLDRHAHKGGPFTIKAGTVVGRHNLTELRAILYLLEKYDVQVWKLYEYIRYTDRKLQKKWDSGQLGITDAEYRAATQAIMEVADRKTPVGLSSEHDRDNSYFMMNPDLEIIVPVRGEAGVFEDKPICSAVDTPVETIEEMWRGTIDWENYASNLKVSLF
jgi:MoaA/NifB/PqqE/SkfB family radical SAM enzyme